MRRSLDVDIDETRLLQCYPEVLKALLVDRSTKKNLVWGTDEYQDLGDGYGEFEQITPASITGLSSGVVQPRTLKDHYTKSNRTKGQGEVFTPTWVCNQQNNLIDAAWFGGRAPFNFERGESWVTTSEPVHFDNDGSWQGYVQEPRMEVACGEAPYLVSRYDATTGAYIAVQERVGLLDRKLRVVRERTRDRSEWLYWCEQAFKSIYAFEIQGDSLLLARENLLASFAEHLTFAYEGSPSAEELLRMAEIISWNIWQMDAFTMQPPGGVPQTSQQSLDFELGIVQKPQMCLIMDWTEKQAIPFHELVEQSKKNDQI